MKNLLQLKISFLFTFIVFMFIISLSQLGLSQCNKPCLTNLLHLNTGFNHENLLGKYSSGTNDEYWRLVSGPNNHGPYPRCAVSWGSGGWCAFSTDYCPIGIGGFNSVADGNYGAVPCSMVSMPYIFERDFEVCNPTSSPENITINLFQLAGDNEIRSVNLLGPGGPYILSSTCLSLPCNTIPPTTLSLHSGIYTLQVIVANGWDWESGFPTGSYSKKTTMSFEMQGFAISGPSLFVDNNHFGKNTALCAPPYKPSPQFEVLGNLCLTPPTTTTNLTISPFNNNPGQNVYKLTDVSGTATLSSNTLNLGVGSYTITSTDLHLCSVTKVIQIGNKPTITIIDSPHCVTPGNTSTITSIITSAGISPYTYTLNGGTTNTNGIFTNLLPGSYTVIVTDANGCTGSASTIIGNSFTTSLIASPICIPSLGSTVISVGTSYSFPVNYNFISPAGITIGSGSSSSVNASSVGTYSVVVTDGAGCTALSTVQVNSLPEFTTNISTCIQPGNFTITVNTTSPIADLAAMPYQIDGGAPQSSNIFNLVSAGTHTVSVTNSNGCIATSIITTLPILVSCCNPNLLSTASAMYFNNTSSSAVSGFVSSFILSTNANIIIDGVFTVDNNFTFFQCPNIFLGPDAQIVMTNGKTLSIENSKLRAACNLLWKGILANNGSQTVKISKSSLLRDMSQGVEMNGITLGNAPILECSGTTFQDNLYSLVFTNTPNGYTGKVHTNIFESTSAFLPPYTKMKRAISIYNCQDLEIGGLVPGLTGLGNTFRNLENGVFISGNKNSFVLVSNIRLYNNTFSKITGGVAVNGQQTLFNNLYTKELGCAIYAKNFSPKLNKANLTITIDNAASNSVPHILNCTKGVVTSNVNVNIANTLVRNTGSGFMNTLIETKKFQIHHNVLDNVICGMEFVGNNAYGCAVYKNSITLPSTLPPALGTTNNFFTPIAIGLTRLSPTYMANFDFLNNTILIPCEGGIGINLRNTGRLVRVIENNIQYTCSNSAGVSFTGTPYFYGIQLSNANQSSVKLNTISGNAISLNYYGDHSGIKMNKSPKLLLHCNQISNIKYGFQTIGDCSTGPTEVIGNQFKNHRYGMLFRHLGQEGSLGNPIGLPATIGTSGYDPNNTFSGSGYTGGNRLFKLSVCGVSNSEKYYTAPSTLSNSQSGGDNSNCKYDVIGNGVPSMTLNCSSILPSIQPPVENQHLENMVTGGIAYAEFEQGAAWLDHQYVYEALRDNTACLSSSSILNLFYQNELNSVSEKICLTNDVIQTLSENANTDPSVFDEKLTYARNKNDKILGEEEQITKERLINNIFLNLIESGLVSIPQNEEAFIESLAFSCPFEYGNAVYKARNIYSYFHPGVDFNEIAICGNGMQNKGQNIFNSENDFLNQLNDSNITLDLSEKIDISPNPARDRITISYHLKENQKSIIVFYDMMGREKKVIHLNSKEQTKQVIMSELEKGLYIYTYKIDGHKISNGKLLIN